MSKTKVAVLYGGRSVEYEASIRSAVSILKNIDRSLFEVIPIIIDKQGDWYLDCEPIATKTPKDEAILSISNFNRGVAIGSGVTFDVVFPALHGPWYEDGAIQGLLELMAAPYVGSGVLGSSICMDKDIAKKLVQGAGLPTNSYKTVHLATWNSQRDAIISDINEALVYPLFVKPANAGSSVGVVKVDKKADLLSGIEQAFQYDTKVVIEQGIDAVELEVAVLESYDDPDNLIASVVGEIRPRNHDYYSYEAKYVDDNGADLIIPANIAKDQAQVAQDYARKIFRILECSDLARIDFLLDKNTGVCCFNEANTMPGFTSISMYPKLLAASGISYKDLITQLINSAVKRQQTRQKLCRCYG